MMQDLLRAASVVLLLAVAMGAAPAPAPGPAATAASPAVSGFAAQHTGASAGVVNWSGKGTGSEKKLGGLDAYVAVPPSVKEPSAAVLLVSDIYGYKTDNVRLWSDSLAAKTGYVVVVPDFFKGSARTPADSKDTFAAWLSQFPRGQVLNETAAVVADVRKIWPSVKKVGVQGFCWGGLYAALLTQGPAGKTPASAAVVYHGSMMTKADVEGINAPVLFQNADPALDQQINATFYKEIEGILSKKKAAGLDAGIASYPGRPHGFSMRGGKDEATTAAANTAFAAGADFLKKHLA